MSAELTWQIIRNNSCFLRRQRGVQKLFSVEPFNLKGVNSPRYNGLVNKKAMDVCAATDGKGVVVSVKKPRKTGLPAKSSNTVILRKKELRSIKNIAKSNGLAAFYKLAQRRASAIIRSQRPKSKKYVKKIEA